MSPTQEPGYAQTRQTTKAGNAPTKPPLVSVCIKDPLVLQRCYLAFFIRGGLFVPCERTYYLRQRLFLILKLPAPPNSSDSMITYGINATVAWLTPPQAQGDQRRGFGLHFDGGGPDMKQSIESLLKALL